MNSITINTANNTDSNISIQQLRQSKFNRAQYDKLMAETKGSLTISYGDDVDGTFLIANTNLTINDVQQKVIDSFREQFKIIEKTIDPERLKFSITGAMDGEICINRKSTFDGRVKLIIHDDGLIALSFVSSSYNNGKDILEFFNLENTDFEQLSYRFFSL